MIVIVSEHHRIQPGDAKSLGAAIREQRRVMRVTQLNLASRIGMHANYLGPIERGSIPSPGVGTITRIAHGLGVSVALLVAAFTDGASRPRNSAPLVERKLGAPDQGPRQFGSALQILRRELHVTQASLSCATGIRRSYIAELEAGRKVNPGIGTLTRLASGLAPDLGVARVLALGLAQAFAREIAPHEIAVPASPASGPNKSTPPVVASAGSEGANTGRVRA